MANVVLGLATSHGPMLTIPAEQWSERVAFDQALPSLAYNGSDYSFDSLAELRRDENLEYQSSLEVRRARFAACRDSIDRLAQTSRASGVRKAVIIGNDQMEVFTTENLPAFLVCTAAQIHNIPFTEVQKTLLGPGILDAEAGHHGPEAEIYPGMPELADHVAKMLVADDFDIAVSNDLPNPPSSRSSGAPHAFGFVYRQIWEGAPIPHLPVFINTFYPPNQPTARRCIAFGRAIGRAIANWEDPAPMAIIGSGGLSHFVVDEKLDRAFLSAIENRDFDAVAAIPEAVLRSGSSELKNWIVAAAALDTLGLRMTRYDYVPCYRSVAGTGNAMAFAEWK